MVKFAQLTDFELLKKQRGNRVRILRTALRLSRRAFAEKYGLPRGTLQNWEDGRFGGLTERGAMQLVEIMRQEGLYCSVEWLLHGIGEGPQLANAIYEAPALKPLAIQDIPLERLNYQERMFINEELDLFRKHYHPHVVDLWVSDDTMAPQFNQGDMVAGRKRYKQDIATLVGQICIVQLSEGSILLRELKAGQQPNQYQLYCLNPAQLEQEAELICAAPVSWWRRKD